MTFSLEVGPVFHQFKPLQSPMLANLRVSIASHRPLRSRRGQWIKQLLLPRPKKYSPTLVKTVASAIVPAVAIWFSHSSQAVRIAAGFGHERLLPRHQVAGCGRRKPEITPTCRQRASERRPRWSGVLQEGAGVITDFRAGCAVLGYFHRLAPSNECRVAHRAG